MVEQKILPPAFQQSEGACGPAALKIVLENFGVRRTEKQLIKMCNCTPASGISANTMIKIVKKLGLKGFIKNNSDIKEIKELLKKEYMVIVSWFLEDDGHYSVVSHFDRENIYLQDPHLGHMRAIRLSIFKRIWFDFDTSYMKTKNDLILRRIIVIHR